MLLMVIICLLRLIIQVCQRNVKETRREKVKENPVSDLSKYRKLKRKEIKAWACGILDCGRQDWVLREGGVIRCNGCNSYSPGTWFIPDIRTGETEIRRPRMKKIRSLDVDGAVCGYCSSILFHMMEDGTINCYRCRRPNLARFFFPNQGTSV